MYRILSLTAFVIIFASGCVTTTDRVLETSQSQVAIRNIQTRSFDTNSKDKVMRNIIAVMQDLGFVVDKVDKELGTISGFSFTSKTHLTASVRAKGKEMLVRVNAEKGTKSITEPQAYQNFFNALSQSLFLQANEVL